uniref:Uncharacterized protein n=1 Tax=Cucumis melo TaxID=3656 RepID=A0A9I9D381_CUCME
MQKPKTRIRPTSSTSSIRNQLLRKRCRFLSVLRLNLSNTQTPAVQALIHSSSALRSNRVNILKLPSKNSRIGGKLAMRKVE